MSRRPRHSRQTATLKKKHRVSEPRHRISEALASSSAPLADEHLARLFYALLLEVQDLEGVFHDFMVPGNPED